MGSLSVLFADTGKVRVGKRVPIFELDKRFSRNPHFLSYLFDFSDEHFHLIWFLNKSRDPCFFEAFHGFFFGLAA